MKIEKPAIASLPALKRLWQEAFGDTDIFLDNFFTTAYHPDRCRIVTIDQKVAAALYWFDCVYRDKPVAYLYAVATALEFRHHGVCHQLMKDTHQHLTGLGYGGVILVPGNAELFRLYEDMGYQVCCHRKEFSCPAGKQKIFCRRIDKKEYATLRRSFLPEGGVIQETHNLDFLETQAEFFTGKDFLLAAHIEENVLHGLELLGNETAASGIVSALGCSRGVFRMPGKDISFAMYRPLADNTLQAPDYFGLPFD